MFKLKRRTLPAWAWISVLLTPAVLAISLSWFIFNQALKTSAVVQIVVKASDAGLLHHPDVQTLVQTAFSGSASFTTLCVSIVVVVLLNFAIIFTARQELPGAKQSA
jgi:hypothetical protein